MNIGSALLWGFVATVVLTSLIAAGQGLGLSRMSITFMLGTMFTADRAKANVIGFIVHFVNGLLFALVYAAAFETVGRSTWWLGVIAAFVHAAFMLTVVMTLMPWMHPLMASESEGPTPTRLLQPPGFLALNYGYRTPLVELIAHLAYGAILGGFYQMAS